MDGINMAMDLWSSGLGAFCFFFYVKDIFTARCKKTLSGALVCAVYFGLDIVAAEQTDRYLLPAAAFLLLLWVYRGRWQQKLYLILSFFAIRELVRFSILHLFTGISGLLVEGQTEKFLAGSLTAASFYEKLKVIETGYGILFFTVFGLLFLVFLYRYKKQLAGYGGIMDMSNAMLSYLGVPAMAGLIYCTIFRNILFYREEESVWMLDRQFPVVRFLIPAGSLFCLASVYLAAFLLKKLREGMEKEREALLYRERLHDMALSVKDMERMYGDVRSMRHDLKNYVADMQLLAAGTELDREAFGEYLKAVNKRVDALSMRYRTGNPVTDVVVNRHLAACEARNIRVENSFVFPADSGIEAFDLSILLNNGLENAMEACPDGGELMLFSRIQGGMFLLSLRNTCGQAPVWENGIPVSRKEAGMHGQGIKNMIRTAEKYEGCVRLSYKEEVFYLAILLRMKDNKGSDTGKEETENEIID